GNVMKSDATFDFFFVAGDANHDRAVDLTDFTVLAANFNRSGVTYSQADFNYDGVVDLTDFTILASKFNYTLAPATAAAPAPPTAAATPPALAPTSRLTQSPFATDRIVDEVV